ncbi:MAG: hypothetical protein QME61_02640 [Patescibacteria group bacterium]|nr:hypothetical protein [Patescibacteria group bacterium]
MRREFPYIQAHPLIEVILAGPKKKIKLLAMIDSGADYSLFDLRIGEKIGIEIGRGEKVILEGIGGEPLIGYLHLVPIQVEKKTFNCKIVFAKTEVALVGRDNFFLPFLITFNEKSQKFLIEENF